MKRLVMKRWTLVLVLLIALAGAWYVFIHQAFDQTAWKDEAQVAKGVRLRMADGLITRHTLSGMDRAQVVELLGEPSKTRKFEDSGLVYWLGPERGFMSIDSEWLLVQFDDTGHVWDYRILRD